MSPYGRRRRTVSGGRRGPPWPPGVGIALAALSLVVGAFQEGLLPGLLMLLFGAPLATLFMLVYARVVAELVIVVFRISENIQKIADQGRPRSGRA